MEAAMVRAAGLGRRLLLPDTRLFAVAMSSAAAPAAPAGPAPAARHAEAVADITPETDPYRIVAPVPESRYAEVLDHVTPIFLRDEPLSQCFPPCTSGQREADFRAYAASQLRSGLCSVALAPAGGVVAACLSRPLTRDKVLGVDVTSLGDEDDDPLNKNVLRMLTAVHQRLNLFDAFGADEIFEVGLAAVDPRHTGKGLATRVIRASLELAARRGYTAAKADATGLASAKACARAGFTQIFELPYAAYTPGDSAVFVKDSDPGAALRVLAARLQPREPFVLPPGFEVDPSSVAGPY